MTQRQDDPAEPGGTTPAQAPAEQTRVLGEMPGTGPVYGAPGPHGAAPVPPPPPPGYGAPGYRSPGLPADPDRSPTGPGQQLAGPGQAYGAYGGSGGDETFSSQTRYAPIIPGQLNDEPEPAPSQTQTSHGGRATVSDDESRSRSQPDDGPEPGRYQQTGHPGQYGWPGQNPSGPGTPPPNPPNPDPNPAPQVTHPPLTRKETNQWAAGAHIGGVLAWIPVVPLIPAIAIYAVYKDRSPYIKQQALEAINFQICVLGAFILASLIDALPILAHFTVLVWAFSALFAVIGAVAALRGSRYRYPLTHRFVH